MSGVIFMASQPSNIYSLLSELEAVLDKGFPLLSNYLVVVKRDTVESLVDSIYASLPTEVQNAKSLLKHCDEMQMEAKQRAQKMITDAQSEASKLLSESVLLQEVQRKAKEFQEQVIADCEELKRKAMEEADAIRIQAREEVNRTKEGASVYAENVLANLEQNLNQLQQIVKSGQVQLERQRSSIDGNNYVEM